MKDNNKIGLLFRVSSSQQITKGSGLDNQKRIGRELADKLGFEIEEFDEGVQSTHNTLISDRMVVVRLLKRIGDKKDPIRRVWVYNTDRFGRDLVESSKIVQAFHRYGVQVYQSDSPTPKDLSSFTDKLLMDIVISIANYDNSLRRMRSNDGKKSSLLRGNTYIGGTIPFGFKVKNKKLVIHEDESIVVKELFEKYSKNVSTKELKKWLDNNPGINPRRSITWSTGTIINMLKNNLYRGIQTWQWKDELPNGELRLSGEPINVNVPKIIDDKLFNRVQSIISDLNETHVRNSNIKHNSLLSGLLKCDKCNLKLSHRYRENIGSGNHYYGRCTERQWKSNEKKIPRDECYVYKSLRIEETDELVLNTLIDLIKKSSNIREEYRTELLNQKEQNKEISLEKSRKIRKRIGELNKSIENLEEIIAVNEIHIVTKDIRKSLANRIIKKSNDEINKKLYELDDLEKKLSVLNDGSKWIDWIDKMSVGVSGIKNQSKEKQRLWIRKFIRSISVKYDDSTKSHNLRLNFYVGLVNDSFKEKGKDGKGYPLYEIIEGERSMDLALEWKKKVESVDLDHLNSTVKEIKTLLDKGSSNNQICECLNSKGIKTIRGNLWNKDTLIKFKNKYVTEPSLK